MTSGATSSPGRDLAVHASVCEECLRAAAALDALPSIDLAGGGEPPALVTPRRLNVEGGPGLPYVGAAIGFVLIVASALVMQAWPLVPEPETGLAGPNIVEGILGGVLRPSDADDLAASTEPGASVEPEPDASAAVAGGHASPAPPPFGPVDVPSATDGGTVAFPAPPSAGATPGPGSPTVTPPPGSPGASIAPSPNPTAPPTVTPTRPPSATPQPTPEPTPEPTPQPTPDPTPASTPPPTPEPTAAGTECSDGLDNDFDLGIDMGLPLLGLLADPQCTSSDDPSESF